MSTTAILTDLELEILTLTADGDPLAWTPDVGNAWEDLLARGLVNDAGGITDAGNELLDADPPPCSGPCTSSGPCDRCTCYAEKCAEFWVRNAYGR